MRQTAARVVLLLVVVTAPYQPPPVTAQSRIPQLPVIRSTLNIGQITVRVLDKNRKPVRGLSQRDFSVFIDGQRRPLLTMISEDATGPISPSAEWIRDIAPDVATNALESPRLVVIVLDDGTTHELFELRTAKEVAYRVIDELGPNDLASIVFTIDNRAPQDFTADRTRLKAAIDRMHLGYGPGDGDMYGYAVVRSMETTELAVEYLKGVPHLRSMVVYITPIGAADLPKLKRSGLGTPDLPQNELALQLFQTAKATLASAEASGVPIYGISTQGLVASARGVDLGAVAEPLRNLARVSGGRAIVLDNLPARHVPAVFLENSHYYTLAYLADGPLDDGRFRRIEVRVDRPDIFVEPGAERMMRILPPRMNRPAVAATTAAMSEIVPLADEPLRLATSAFAAQAESDSRKTAALILALGLDVPTGDRPADLVQVEMRIFDGEGRKQLDQRDLAVRLPASSNQARLHDVFIVTTLKPGRYNVRVSTFSTLRNRAGSVYTDISVPDFYKTPFAVSDPVVFQSPGSTTHGVASIEAMKLPLPPTTIRVFEQKQRGVVFTRAYWGRRTSNPQPASLIATVTNDQNRDVWRVAQLVLPSRSEPIASADVQFDLPLNELPPGEYLFKLVARSKNQSDIVKHVRFTVR